MTESDTHREVSGSIAAPEVSVVVPLLDEDESLPELITGLEAALQSFKFEVILVDDGSKDESWQIIQHLSSSRKWLKAVSHQRNYGKSSALQTGFNIARGKWIATLDADLQDDPAEIPDMIWMLKDGYDLVSGWKRKRQDPITKTIPSRFFNLVTRWVTGIRLHDFNCGLKVYRREVIEEIELFGELHRYVPLLAQWKGYNRIGEKPVRHHKRKYGRTKFGLSRFINGFLDLMTLMLVDRYMSRPMHFFGTLGVLSLVTGGVINLYLFWIKVFDGQSLADRPLLFLGILLVVVGVQFFSIGFLGEIFNRGRASREQPNIRERIRA